MEEILPSAAKYYYSHDSLGSTRALTDSLGAVQDTDIYDPYGNITTTGSVQNNLLYAGQYLDSESGLYYLRAREYDPVTAQFLTADPRVASTMEPYAYAVGDPTNAADPTGQDANYNYYFAWDLGAVNASRNPRNVLWWLQNRPQWEFPFTIKTLTLPYTVHAPGQISNWGDAVSSISAGHTYAIDITPFVNPIRVDFAGMVGSTAVVKFTALPGHSVGDWSTIRFSSWVSGGHLRFDVTGHDTFDYGYMPFLGGLFDLTAGWAFHGVGSWAPYFRDHDLWSRLAQHVNGGSAPTETS